MRKLILLSLLSVTVFAQEEINVAKANYGSIGDEEIVDNSIETAAQTNNVNVELPLQTKINRVSLNFAPNKGKIVIKTKIDGKEVILKEIVINGTEEGISVELQELEAKNINFEWVPDVDGTLLEVKDVGIFTKAVENIALYESIKKDLTSSLVAGSESSIVNTTEVTFTDTALSSLPPIIPQVSQPVSF